MMAKRKGLQDISTVMKTGQPRRKRTPDQIFNDLTQLNRERMRLYQEKIFWQEKIERIDKRMNQIERIRKSLQQQMDAVEKSFQQQIELKTKPEKPALEAQNERQKASHSEVVITY